LAIGILTSSGGCNTRIAGCLDPAAFNFDLDAERDCSGCCVYPVLSVSLSQKWDDRNYSTSDTLLDVHQQPYQIVDLKYFLSSWTWLDAEDRRYSVDSSVIDCDDTQLQFTNDIALVDTRQFVYTLGTIRNAPAIDSFRLHLGLTEDFSCIMEEDPGVPENLTMNSPLWDSKAGELSAIRLVVRRDLVQEVLDTLFISTLLQTDVYFPFNFMQGANAQPGLSVNYARWFSGVDKNDLNSYQTSILNGFEGSLYQTP
jgi:hypothetical protein